MERDWTFWSGPASGVAVTVVVFGVVPVATIYVPLYPDGFEPETVNSDHSQKPGLVENVNVTEVLLFHVAAEIE